jgi:hypothetical protein
MLTPVLVLWRRKCRGSEVGVDDLSPETSRPDADDVGDRPSWPEKFRSKYQTSVLFVQLVTRIGFELAGSFRHNGIRRSDVENRLGAGGRSHEDE